MKPSTALVLRAIVLVVFLLFLFFAFRGEAAADELPEGVRAMIEEAAVLEDGAHHEAGRQSTGLTQLQRKRGIG
jgi:hypothetical protein